MSVRLLCVSTVSAIILAACATSQENPNYQYSTKYKGSSPYGTSTSTSTGSTQPVNYVQGTTRTTQPVTYTQSSTSQYPVISANTGYTRIDHNCLRQETNRQLIGGAVGGTIGAVAGKQFIGGTKGTIIGAAAGGAAGYGLGDKSINCDPVPVPVTQTSTIVTQPYQTPAQYAQPQTQPQTYVAPTDRAYGAASGGTPGYDAINGGRAATTYMPTQPEPNYTSAQPQQPVYINPQPIYVQPPVSYQPPASMTPVSSSTPQPIYTAPGYAPHQVSEGDTVYSMARQLCVGIEDIRQINSLDANFNIKLGEFIQLPTSRCR